MAIDLKIIIRDDAEKHMADLLEVRNNYQRRANYPELTLEQLVQEHVDQAYGITAADLAVRERDTKRAAITAKIVAADAKTLDAILAAVDAVAVAVAVDPIEDPVVDPKADPVVTP
jgi:hypothetical protein